MNSPTPTFTGKMSSRWALLVLIFVARIGVGFQFIAIAALMTDLQTDIKLTYSEIGLLLGAFMIAAVFLSLPSGIIAKRLGDRKTLIYGLMSLVAGEVILGLSQGFYGVLASRLVGGIGAVFITVTGAKILSDRFSGKEIATAMSVLGVSWPVGIALGLTVLPLMGIWTDWRIAVFSSLVLPALAAIALCIMPLKFGSDEPKTTIPKPSRLTSVEVTLIVLGGIAWTLMSSGGYVVFSSFAPTYLIEHGTGKSDAALITSLLSWLIILTIPVGGYLADRTGKGDQMFWSGCFISAFSIAMVPIGGPVLLWVILAASMGITVGTVMSLPNDALSKESRAIGMGLFYSVYYVGVVGLPALAGLIQETSGATEIVIWFSAICLLLSPLFLFVFRKLQQRNTNRNLEIQLI